MKTYLSVLLKNCIFQYNCFRHQLYFFKINSKISLHIFESQDDVNNANSGSTISNQSPLNFRKVFCEIKSSFRTKEFIPEPIFLSKKFTNKSGKINLTN